MTNRLLSLGFLASALMVGGGLSPSRVEAAEGKSDARAIAISEPAASVVNSDLHQLGDKKDGLKQLEDDLFKPIKKTFSPKGSLEGVLLVPPQTRTSNRTIPQTKKE